MLISEHAVLWRPPVQVCLWDGCAAAVCWDGKHEKRVCILLARFLNYGDFLL